MRKNWIDKILYGTTVVLALIGIGMVVYKLIGHSPTVEDILLIFQAAIITILIGHIHHTSKFEGTTTADINHIKRDLQELKGDVKDIKKHIGSF